MSVVSVVFYLLILSFSAFRLHSREKEKREEEKKEIENH
jgi:hypothetical protein